MNTVTATINTHFVYNTKGDDNDLRNLLNDVAHLTRVPVSDIRGANRRKEIVIARQLYCAAACILYPSKSLSEIGTIILKDHATVLYHRDDVNDKITMKDEKSRKLAEMLRILIA